MKSESETVYNQFSKAKQQQKYIWISSMLFVTVAFIGMLVLLYYQSKNVVVIKENGQKVSAVVGNEKETFTALASEHLDRAFKYANSFDRFTYKDNMAKTLFHMDSRSANRLFSEYENSGALADVLSKGTIYDAEILSESIRITGDREPFEFVFQGTIDVNDGGHVTKYLAQGTGELIYYTPHYPENPTGFFITNYTQKTKIYEQK